MVGVPRCPLARLAESPGSFTATLAEEDDRDEQFWRDRMTRSHRLLAERGPVAQGIVSLGPYEQEPSVAEVCGLYVVPEARGTGVSWRIVEAAAALATQQGYLQLYYWVGTDNGRVVGFANNFGFRITDYRRPSRSSDRQPGEEIAMVLSLEPDATLAPNPTSAKPATREGPQLKPVPEQQRRWIGAGCAPAPFGGSNQRGSLVASHDVGWRSGV